MVEQGRNKADNFKGAIGGRWAVGESGNDAGRPVNEDSITYWYKKLLAEGKTAKEIATTMLEKAKEGSLGHTQEITDRTDGTKVDKHLNLNVSVTPESLQEAQDRLLQAKQATDTLLDKYPKRITDATK